ncbi:Shedu immune nuclease family protein [Desulfosporosinus hippei]|uniref:Shedu protein SduA C-terminal domain-containing protein n=1 Tax=Desulfosporosinus hippei DSM 8344 TaxID=1121419 RepID=A0A1G8D5F4_9FIRM|nr:Shedu immune nuclease family protein [Desulfosporosinus hippei]SDH52966.1 protein of unknown function [Desulfosporosinus hippei DSM 8344]
MKISDMIFNCKVNSLSRFSGLYRIRIFITSKQEVYSVITDIGDYNPSTSVTNAIEYICSTLISAGVVPKETCFIEHYEPQDYYQRMHSFDIVTFDGKGLPHWTSIGFQKIINILECDKMEFLDTTFSNPRLMNEIDRLRYQMDPKIDFPDQENPEIIKRRFEIEYNNISKEKIISLIESNVKEQDISRLLKQDLSLFGEVYAHPKEEYICFSEFPINNGVVDFVVFTGRSRMDVYLIEVKGSNFNLVNSGNYEKLSSKVEEATGQIRERLQIIYNNYEKYRVEFHKIRKTVESGTKIYNSFIGPYGDLLVDPDKDVNIHPVVIAGRTNNDLMESRKRQAFEFYSKPTIKLETWDSWIRKLTRR